MHKTSLLLPTSPYPPLPQFLFIPVSHQSQNEGSISKITDTWECKLCLKAESLGFGLDLLFRLFPISKLDTLHAAAVNQIICDKRD